MALQELVLRSRQSEHCCVVSEMMNVVALWVFGGIDLMRRLHQSLVRRQSRVLRELLETQRPFLR